MKEFLTDQSPATTKKSYVYGSLRWWEGERARKAKGKVADRCDAKNEERKNELVHKRGRIRKIK